MTNKPDEAVAVTDADREAVASIYYNKRDPDYAVWIRNGKKDDEEPLVKAFAAHRTATEADLTGLVHRYYLQEIGRLMHQAEHWAKNSKPHAVLHWINKADEYYQVVQLFDPDRTDKGHKPTFEQIRQELDEGNLKPDGQYPPKQDVYDYGQTVSGRQVDALRAQLAAARVMCTKLG